ncbi:G-protein subunit alpha 1 [Pelomyxa schiedti]|nr:G-protein subunit alpha 1 [Pelomyxa schiedti]
MGCIQSPEAKRDAEISTFLAAEGTKYEHDIKLLLLGSGESGKSTLAKQMKIIHLNGYTDEERCSFKVAIYNNLVSSMRALVKGATTMGLVVAASEAAAYVSRPEFEMLYDPITPELSGAIKKLWADPGIKGAFARSNEFQLLDSAEYFLESIDRLADPHYVPTVKDVLMSRIKTTGVSEMEFTLSKSHFRIVDVGGQRSERKKWMNCFPDVTAIIFVVALSEYDLKLYEDNTTNRMFESMKLFKEICSNPFISNVPIILFFNKSDIFRQKITKVDLSVCFPEYKGGPNFDAASEFIQEKFMSLNSNSAKTIYPNVTCATDTGNITTVFNAVTDIILRNIIKNA